MIIETLLGLSLLVGISEGSSGNDSNSKGEGDSCPKKLANVFNSKSIYDITIDDLKKIMRVPDKIDGLVAKLYDAPDLHIYGIANTDLTRIERIEIYGYDKMPLRLMTFNVWNSRNSAEMKIFTKDNNWLYPVLIRLPGLIELFVQKQYLTPKPAADQIRAFRQKMDAMMDEHLEKHEEPVHENWDSVFTMLYRHAKKTQDVKEQFESRPNVVAELPAVFEGFLGNSNPALAKIKISRKVNLLSLQVALNPVYVDLVDPAFPDLSEKIEIEGRFRLQWLDPDLKHLIFIKITDLQPKSPLEKEILVYEKEEDLPTGVAYERVNLEDVFRP